ncbi:glycoside hydrolase family 3 C-terminal domain-containing protein [Vallitalea guaymasensis]|uniref:Glycoside hydrolase family 3 C-terminal domain-containing protein n=1 Tax=Vallitalea guaymasensis TaxID=1185412 RepID=A0A8J8SDH5_9FIRM|nr:glycoside hydrolase family 3 C-terminal domain-containing protein [Vallitalea guaymasensis]QUH30729.1 glycoside hydrolase family 3 C-terminal domain-containing protein [Vallitalea guaymasensis]
MNEFPYMDTELSFDERVNDLVSRMSLIEKVSQLVHNASPVERLGIPAYNWWNEALHGVARAGVATVFPQAIALGATFDEELINQVATVISDEGRAKYHEFQRQGDCGLYKGLTFWSPNINIFRDPRWGRGHETFGEDPYLTSRLGVNFVEGLQGTDDKYLKSVATPKHYAVHSGPEKDRHSFDAEVSIKDIRETYLPAFKACVTEGKAEAIMGAYNRVNGEPCCGSHFLLQDILRDEWGFQGHVVSDCGALMDFHAYHHITKNPIESAALALNNGCELNCGDTFEYLMLAHDKGLISEDTIDAAVKRLLKVRFRLGMFDDNEDIPYSSIPYEVVACDKHRELALEVTKKSAVLLKNKNNILPLDKNEIKSIGVIGPNANDRRVLVGNYNGTPIRHVTVLEGIQNAVNDNTRVYYAEGCKLIEPEVSMCQEKDSGFSEAISVAKMSDAVIMCLGLSPIIEGEQGDAANSDASGDKIHLDLPGQQQKLMEEVYKTGKPIILILLNGSAVAINWADDNVDAILEGWYPGGEGGNAIADIIFGDDSPSGKLPITFYRSLDDIPSFDDYSMKNRTYRYFEKEPLYPFGYGLGYTSFEFSNLVLSKDILQMGEDLLINVDVTNTGDLSGYETVQLYVKDLEASVDVPKYELKGFKKVLLKPEETKTIELVLKPRQLALIDNDGECKLEPGSFQIFVGGSQPDGRSIELTKQKVLDATFEVVGNIKTLKY